MTNNFRFADKVSIGNEILVEGNDHLTPAKVMNIRSFTMEGNPQLTLIFLP